MMLFVSKLPLLLHLQENGSFEEVFSNLTSLRFQWRDAFENSRGDEVTFFVDKKDFVSVLENDLLLSAIRLFNLRMMNNVGNEEGFSRTVSHCLDLADVLIG